MECRCVRLPVAAADGEEEVEEGLLSGRRLCCPDIRIEPQTGTRPAAATIQKDSRNLRKFSWRQCAAGGAGVGWVGGGGGGGGTGARGG